ncbi:MAG: endonuclease/exonuclease/phosphatase family protein [Bacteroidales bacterium]|nr:endonuclease/exonuclease/phosphatase family protein [Bacteroidales bacterium]MCF8333050.1 endonuclease/exonuclease/phosphatase family protein [Bacteroidales bacterium]
MVKSNNKVKDEIVKQVLVGVNSFFTLLLLISYLAYYVPPSPGWFFGIPGLAYPVFLVINFLFLIVWIILRSKYLIISLFGILIGWNHVERHISISSDNPESPPEGLKIISYNIQTNKYTPQKEQLIERVADYLQEKQPRIACLQECFLSRKQLDDFSKKSGFKLREAPTPSQAHGLYTFTDLPVIKTGILSSNNAKFAVYHQVTYNSDTVRIYNTQLASIKLQKEKNLFDQEERDWKSQESQEQITSMFKKFNKAYNQRTNEVRLLKKHIAECKYPVILCGDFNDTPLSYTYQNLNQHLTDPFPQFGRGFGNTHNENLPPIRIDYILHDDMYQTQWYKIDEAEFSDHFPVSAVITKK